MLYADLKLDELKEKLGLEHISFSLSRPRDYEKEEVGSLEFIEWDFDWSKMDEVISELQQRFGEEYLIITPEESYDFIRIYKKDSSLYRNYLELKDQA